MVDATAGHGLLSFMDTYCGYNQINMHPPEEDPQEEDKMMSIIDQGIYCYKIMPFGLKERQSNLPMDGQQGLQEADWTHYGGIHQQHAQKSHQSTNCVQHLSKAFDHLQKYNIRLSPEKFTFNISSV